MEKKTKKKKKIKRTRRRSAAVLGKIPVEYTKRARCSGKREIIFDDREAHGERKNTETLTVVIAVEKSAVRSASKSARGGPFDDVRGDLGVCSTRA
jgi:hypothetical protein